MFGCSNALTSMTQRIILNPAQEVVGWLLFSLYDSLIRPDGTSFLFYDFHL